LSYFELCEQAVSYSMLGEVYVHCRSPVVTVVSCEEHRTLKTIHWSSAHSTCRKLATCVIQPHTVKCVTQTPIC